MDPSRDYYRILEVHPQAGADVIERAKRVLLQRYHPDHNPERPGWAAERTREILEAYAILSDPQRRQEYDRARARWLAEQRTKGVSSAAQDRRPTRPPEDGTARTTPKRSRRPNATPQEPLPPHLRWIRCQGCGRYSRVPRNLSPTQVRCGACGEPLRLSLRERWRRRLLLWDTRAERLRNRLLGLLRLPGRR
ncbi:MAG: hypothetical protein KatS3mg115_1557 [Candidatus Poribacteria bacterium]|nr:MAG: hypothetical protein KatS3mg115_1557 [Candidatus Poribacteria bacterium]